MPTFEWKGTARNGQTQTGLLVADTKDAVIVRISRLADGIFRFIRPPTITTDPPDRGPLLIERRHCANCRLAGGMNRLHLSGDRLTLVACGRPLFHEIDKGKRNAGTGEHVAHL